MSQFEEETIKVRLELPDELSGAAWAAYSKVRRDNSVEDALTMNYIAALSLCGSATIEVGGAQHDLKMLAYSDVRVNVVKWVGDTVVGWVNQQFIIEKNSSEPPSKSRTSATAPEKMTVEKTALTKAQ